MIFSLGQASKRRPHGCQPPRACRAIDEASCAHRYTRTGPATLTLELVDGAIRSAELAAGDTVELEGMRARVLARGADGPSRIEFEFDRPLDDPETWLLGWRHDRLEHVTAPPIGGEIVL